MNLDELYLLVTDAILRAEALDDLNAPGATNAFLDVSLLEERIARDLTASRPEGAIARRGAVRAAVAAGSLRRAELLVGDFSRESDSSEALRWDLSELIKNSRANVGSQHEVPSGRDRRAWNLYLAHSDHRPVTLGNKGESEQGPLNRTYSRRATAYWTPQAWVDYKRNRGEYSRRNQQRWSYERPAKVMDRESERAMNRTVRRNGLATASAPFISGHS
jgi:hypothetical protein